MEELPDERTTRWKDNQMKVLIRPKNYQLERPPDGLSDKRKVYQTGGLMDSLDKRKMYQMEELSDGITVGWKDYQMRKKQKQVFLDGRQPLLL